MTARNRRARHKARKVVTITLRAPKARTHPRARRCGCGTPLRGNPFASACWRCRRFGTPILSEEAA